MIFGECNRQIYLTTQSIYNYNEFEDGPYKLELTEDNIEKIIKYIHKQSENVEC